MFLSCSIIYIFYTRQPLQLKHICVIWNSLTTRVVRNRPTSTPYWLFHYEGVHVECSWYVRSFVLVNVRYIFFLSTSLKEYSYIYNPFCHL